MIGLILCDFVSIFRARSGTSDSQEYLKWSTPSKRSCAAAHPYQAFLRVLMDGISVFLALGLGLREEMPSC